VESVFAASPKRAASRLLERIASNHTAITSNTGTVQLTTQLIHICAGAPASACA